MSFSLQVDVKIGKINRLHVQFACLEPSQLLLSTHTKIGLKSSLKLHLISFVFKQLKKRRSKSRLRAHEIHLIDIQIIFLVYCKFLMLLACAFCALPRQ